MYVYAYIYIYIYRRLGGCLFWKQLSSWRQETQTLKAAKHAGWDHRMTDSLCKSLR